MKHINIVLTLGDPAGIGPEVLAKALNRFGSVKDAAFFVVGDSYVLKRYGLKKRPNVFLIDLKNVPKAVFQPGKPNRDCAKASLEYLKEGLSLIKNGLAHCLVTGPISKESVWDAGFSWPGHTEFLAHSFGVKNVEMVFVSEGFRVVLVTRHMSLKHALRCVTKKNIERCASLMMDLLIKISGIKNPKIAVCGLNPHAGEAGLFGREEIDQITPAIKNLNRIYGKHFFGPFAADTLFHRAYHGEFDLVMAMYHDQGLIPFKMVAFESGVNLTVGLPFIRTSPVHGTAFDIAGKNMADHRSMASALELAYILTKARLR